VSFITLDYKCQTCGAIEERFVRRSEVDMQFCDCVTGGSAMDKLPAGPITTFKFGDRSATKSRKAVSLRDKH
jgi:hypothetical protein